jgi:hypothetical protein
MARLLIGLLLCAASALHGAGRYASKIDTQTVDHHASGLHTPKPLKPEHLKTPKAPKPRKPHEELPSKSMIELMHEMAYGKQPYSPYSSKTKTSIASGMLSGHRRNRE